MDIYSFIQILSVCIKGPVWEMTELGTQLIFIECKN